MKLPNLSASGYGTFKDCPRKWWYEKVIGLRGPPTEAMSMGTRMHALIETYLKTGAWTGPYAAQLTPLCVPALEWLVPLRHRIVDPQRDAFVEAPLSLPAGTLGTLPIKGFVDYCDDTPLVIDHKTKNDLSDTRFLYTAETVTGDPQMLFYAQLLWGDVRPPTVELGHIYYSRSTPGADGSARGLATWGQVEDNTEKFVQAAHAMHSYVGARDKEQAHEIPHDLAACAKYGGCPHAAYCPKPIFASIQKGAQMSTIAELMAQRAAATGPVVNPPDTPGTQTPTAAQIAECADAVRAGLTAIGGEITEERVRLVLTDGGMLAKSGLPASSVDDVTRAVLTVEGGIAAYASAAVEHVDSLEAVGFGMLNDGLRMPEEDPTGFRDSVGLPDYPQNTQFDPAEEALGKLYYLVVSHDQTSDALLTYDSPEVKEFARVIMGVKPAPAGRLTKKTLGLAIDKLCEYAQDKDPWIDADGDFVWAVDEVRPSVALKDEFAELHDAPHKDTLVEANYDAPLPSDSALPPRMIFVGCRPDSAAIPHFDQLFAEQARFVETELELGECVPYTAVPYRQGVEALAGYLRKSPGAPTPFYLDHAHPFVQCLAVAFPNANVVRGVK